MAFDALSRRRCFEDIDVNLTTNNATTSNKAPKKARSTPLKIYSFKFKKASPSEVQVFSAHSLYDLVDFAFKVFNPRKNGDQADTHLWNLWVNAKLKFKSTQAKTVTLAAICQELDKGSKITVEYDYASTKYYEFTLTSIQEANNNSIQVADFPRPKPLRPPAQPSRAVAAPASQQISLNEAFPALNQWCFRPGQVKELNFFQAGRKHVYGYFETHEQQMIMLPSPANSLGHYLQCLEQAVATPRGLHGWHSIIVLPTNNNNKPLPKRLTAFQQDLEPGFCDCHMVEEDKTNTTRNWNQAFPKIAAFAGYNRDKRIKKGWIRYKDRVLLVCTGSGSPVAHPHSPKGTAFHGEGPHVPAEPSQDVLFGIRKKFESLHELFSEVEALLGTL